MKNGWAGWVAVGFLGVMGGALVYLSSPWGIGVGFDSYFYLTAAENLLEGAGLGRFSAEGQFLPLVHFPPLYPLLLSGVSWLAGVEAATAARSLAAVLLAANLMSLALVVGRAVGEVRWGLAAGLLALASPSVVERHLWAMSEPLFFLLLLAVMGSVAGYLTEGRRVWLVLAAITAALAYLTRYAGLAAIGAGLLAVFLLGGAKIRDKLMDVAVFSGISALLIGPWLWRNLRVQGTLTNRRLVFHPIPAEGLRQAGRTVADWLPLSAVPAEIRLVLLVGAVLLLATVGLRWILNARSAAGADGSHHLVGVAGLFGLSYTALLAVSLLFFDASTRLDERILSPLYWVLLLVGFVILGRSVGTRRGMALAALTLVLLGIPLASATSERLLEARSQGLGFHSRQWRQSETVEAVSQLPQDATVYSNEAIPLTYLTGRGVHAVPERIDPVLGAERPDYRQQLRRMRSRLSEGDGFLVLFHPQALRVEMPPLVQLTQGFAPVRRLSDGTIYRPQD